MEFLITYLTPERAITAIAIVILGIAEYWWLRIKRPPAADTNGESATPGSGIKVMIINKVTGSKSNRRRRVKRRPRRRRQMATLCYCDNVTGKEK